MDSSNGFTTTRQAPAGFYNTADEKEEGKKQALDPRFEALRVDKMEAERRDQEEARERARDKKRHKKLTQENLPQVGGCVSDLVVVVNDNARGSSISFLSSLLSTTDGHGSQ